MPFGVTPADLLLVGFLCFLEGILSIDNALVLAMMVRHLPHKQQRRALTYGLAGAVVFRLLALMFATHLMQLNWVKFVGGAYLIFVAVKHMLAPSHAEAKESVSKAGFIKTVIMVELMDIAFAVDSILAAVAVTPKFWIIFTGGMAGVVLIRFAASGFIKLLDRFPGFEMAAFIMIFIIGTKIFLEGFHLPALDFHSSSSPAFWIFWSLIGLSLISGFFLGKGKKKPQDGTRPGA